MTVVDINDELYRNVKKFIIDNNIEYPTLQNFVNKAVRNQLRIDMIQEKEKR